MTAVERSIPCSPPPRRPRLGKLEFWDPALLDELGRSLEPDSTLHVESLADLQQITGTTENHNNTGASLLEAPSVFDLCRCSEGSKYVLVSMVYCEDGGPLFVIPRSIADQCPNVARCIELSSAFWGV